MITMYTLSHFRLLCLLLVLTLSWSGCKDDDPVNGAPAITYGESGDLYGGTIKTYYQADAAGVPLELGIVLPDQSMNELGGHHDAMAMFSLDIPARALEQTAFRHMMFDWNPHGHEPVGVFDLPHFDLHYYYTSESDRMAITPMDTVEFMQPVAAGTLPDYYVNIGGVPQMGAHWIDPIKPVFNGSEAFTEVFIYGSYAGKTTFMEPMITRAFVLEKKDFEADIPQPAVFPVTGKYYPRKYGFKFMAAEQEYHFYVSDFVLQ